jgi:hypothetical protein
MKPASIFSNAGIKETIHVLWNQLHPRLQQEKPTVVADKSVLLWL